MSKYKTTVTQVCVHREGTDILDDHGTYIELVDEGAGYFVKLSQPCATYAGEPYIEFTPDEIDVIMEASKDLIEQAEGK